MTTFRDKLKSGIPQIGLCAMYPAPGPIERIGGDWDFIWIDAQHGEMDYNDVLGIVRACDLVKTAGLVRIPWLDPSWISKALDTNAAGVIVPCIDSVEEAKLAASFAKFPPIGRRSYGGRRPIDFKGRTYSDTANDDTLLIVQIESPAAIEAADAIAAVPGVDALMIGPDDLMLRRGYTMNTPRNNETLGNDMRAIAAATKKHGKFAMGVGIGKEMFDLNMECGFDLIVAGGDVPFLALSSKTASTEARGWRDGKKAAAKTGGAQGPY